MLSCHRNQLMNYLDPLRCLLLRTSRLFSQTRRLVFSGVVVAKQIWETLSIRSASMFDGERIQQMKLRPLAGVALATIAPWNGNKSLTSVLK